MHTLIHNITSQKFKRYSRRTAFAAFSVLTVAATYHSCGLFTQPTHAEDNLGAITPSQYSVSLSSSGTVAMNLETVPYTNVIRAGKDTVTANITAPASSTSKTRLLISTDSTTSNALTNGSNSIPATTGTIESPVALTGNSWGYALPNTTPGITTNGFDSSYTVPEPGAASKWAGVPKQGNEQLLTTNTMNQSTISTDVYYGVSATDSLASGTYTGNVVYTAIYDAAPTQEANLDKTTGTKDDTVIATTAAVVPAGMDLGSATVTMGTGTSAKAATVTGIARNATTGLVEVTFTVPDMGANGNYPVTVTLDKIGVTYTSSTNFAYTGAGPTTFDQAFAAAGKTKDEHSGYYKMQDMDSGICAAVTAPTSATSGDEQTTTLVDYRVNGYDNKTYQVGKLADGNCWMQENLRLGSGSDISLDDSNTNLATGTTFTLPGMSTGTSWSSTSYTNPYVYPSNDQNTDSTKGALGYYGYYYNYYAASAGTVDGTIGSADATSDICPKGWSLPEATASGATKSYGKLLYAYGATNAATGTSSKTYTTDGYTKVTSAPLQFVLTGNHGQTGTTYDNRGTEGFYWTKHSATTANANALSFTASSPNPTRAYSKKYGATIRCVAK